MNVKQWSAKGTHTQVLELLLHGKRTGAVLDIAAGPGAMSKVLHEAGFQVSACDLKPENFQVDGIKCQKVDLNIGLPQYQTESFEYATCLDVLEHIENQFLLLREIYRILKPGGIVIFSTPNILHIQARILFLLTGYFPGFKDGDFSLSHINPVYAKFFPKMLIQIGFLDVYETYNRGWIYISQAKGTLLKENGFEIPWKNALWGQVSITKTRK